jgi:2'-5' RNA ligase
VSFFLAVDLDDAVRADVAGHIARLRGEHPGKWLLPDRLHVTILFLATLPGPAAADAAIDALAARHGPFDLALAGAGLFATARAAAVVWLGVATSAPLLALRQDACASLAEFAAREAAPGEAGPGEAGPGEATDRPYTPHLTLARAHRPGALDGVQAALSTYRSAPFRVQRLTLYESRGTTFQIAHQTPLAGRTAL